VTAPDRSGCIAFLRRVWSEIGFGRVPIIRSAPRFDVAHRPDARTRCRWRADAGGDGWPASSRLHNAEACRRLTPPRLSEWVKGKGSPIHLTLVLRAWIPNVAALVRAAVARFSELGASVEEISIPWGGPGPSWSGFFWFRHQTGRKPLLEEMGKQMDPGLVACIREAEYPVDAYQAGARTEDALHRDIIAVRNWTFLLTPSVFRRAFPAEKLMPEHWPSHPGLDFLGRSFPTVQYVVEPGIERAVWITGRVAGRNANRWPAV